jgi:hypothetical protein
MKRFEGQEHPHLNKTKALKARMKQFEGQERPHSNNTKALLA